jgi:hypothetical protein
VAGAVLAGARTLRIGDDREKPETSPPVMVVKNKHGESEDQEVER